MDDLQSSYKRFLNSVEKSKHQVDSVNDLQRVYSLLSNEETKAKSKIDDIGRKLKNCDRLHAEYLRDVMEEAIAYLNGIHIAVDIVWKELHK